MVMSNAYVEACPDGWLLEALAGHPLDWLLFPCRSLWWHYHELAWQVIRQSGSFPADPSRTLFLPCGQCRTAQQSVLNARRDPQDNSVVSLSAAVIWRHYRIREACLPAPTGRISPEKFLEARHERLFWAGACKECNVIHW
ncbi:MAG: hypothetical protein IIA44_13060, partial [Acidobacteria bacterium]|nr:hypothetical protein [Acidobacteriota bacterium]